MARGRGQGQVRGRGRGRPPKHRQGTPELVLEKPKSCPTFCEQIRLVFMKYATENVLTDEYGKPLHSKAMLVKAATALMIEHIAPVSDTSFNYNEPKIIFNTKQNRESYVGLRLRNFIKDNSRIPGQSALLQPFLSHMVIFAYDPEIQRYAVLLEATECENAAELKNCWGCFIVEEELAIDRNGHLVVKDGFIQYANGNPVEVICDSKIEYVKTIATEDESMCVEELERSESKRPRRSVRDVDNLKDESENDTIDVEEDDYPMRNTSSEKNYNDSSDEDDEDDEEDEEDDEDATCYEEDDTEDKEEEDEQCQEDGEEGQMDSTIQMDHEIAMDTFSTPSTEGVCKFSTPWPNINVVSGYTHPPPSTILEEDGIHSNKFNIDLYINDQSGYTGQHSSRMATEATAEDVARDFLQVGNVHVDGSVLYQWSCNIEEEPIYLAKGLAFWLTLFLDGTDDAILNSLFCKYENTTNAQLKKALNY
jgi:hypothetical protein